MYSDIEPARQGVKITIVFWSLFPLTAKANRTDFKLRGDAGLISAKVQESVESDKRKLLEVIPTLLPRDVAG